jgi:hypothetical protein
VRWPIRTAPVIGLLASGQAHQWQRPAGAEATAADRRRPGAVAPAAGRRWSDARMMTRGPRQGPGPTGRLRPRRRGGAHASAVQATDRRDAAPRAGSVATHRRRAVACLTVCAVPAGNALAPQLAGGRAQAGLRLQPRRTRRELRREKTVSVRAATKRHRRDRDLHRWQAGGTPTNTT